MWVIDYKKYTVGYEKETIGSKALIIALLLSEWQITKIFPEGEKKM